MSTLTCQSHPPKCKREECNNLVSKLKRKKSGRIWQTYCCATCQVPALKGVYQNADVYKIDAPICANERCSNPVSRRSRKSYGWNKYCCLNCQKTSAENIRLTKETNILRYGNEIPAQSDSIKAKTSLTIKKLWSNRTDDERLTVFKKSQSGLTKRKSYLFASGKIIQVRGYEPKALDELLLKYTEYDIIAGNEIDISIPYFRKNKQHKYYPDIYIPKDNLIIEVKSKWTYSGKSEWFETNILKEQACKDAGYNFRFMIY